MDIVNAYSADATVLATRYEGVAAPTVHAPFVDIISMRSDAASRTRPLALDVGAGSGRDAAWLSSLDYEVVAVEPSIGMRSEAQRRHSLARSAG
jgi:protein-L-isoaspartate O-methyltransferase